MPDSANPTGPAPDGRDSARSHEDELEVALDLVRRVTALCTRQLATERLAPVPDETRIDQLKGELEACAADRKALQSADAGEVARIAALYTARFKELSGP